MQFAILFKSDYYAYCLPTRNIGLAFVDKVRAEKKVNLPISRFIGYVPAVSSSQILRVKVDEEYAREAYDIFAETNEVEVKVGKDFMNQFFYIGYEESVDSNTGEIYEIRPTWKVDYEGIRKFWKEMGYELDLTDHESA